jgi:hypothetical protein
MTLFTVRRSVAAASMALIAATLVTPASAHELDEDDAAVKICGPGVAVDGSEFYDTAESGDEAEVDVYSYAIGAGDIPDSLCTFAIISTDDESTLNGNYTLSVGAAAPVSGVISGSLLVTKPIITKFSTLESATFTASGKQMTPKTSSEKKAAKKKYAKAAKAAKAKFAKASKAAKAKYVKAKKTAKAKKVMTAKIASAKKKYKATLASANATKKRKSSPSERSYSLNLNVPFIY